MSFISALQNCGCLSASTIEPRESIVVERNSCCTQLQEISLVAARVFSAIAAGATAIIFLASGSLIAGAFAIGLTCLTVCLWPSTDTQTYRVARDHLHTNPFLAPPLYSPSPIFLRPSTQHMNTWAPPIVPSWRTPDELFAPSIDRHYSPLRDERVQVASHTSSFEQPSFSSFLVPAAPYHGEDRIQVGDHRTIEEDQDERVAIRRR